MDLVTCFGDVTSVQFLNEKETVLFVPESGDVFRCLADDWDQLLQKPSDQASELGATLLRLGISLS